MDRKKYLELCQKCSAFVSSAREENIPKDCFVIYNGEKFIPQYYKISFDKSGRTIHSVGIKYPKANSIVVCPLESIEFDYKE